MRKRKIHSKISVSPSILHGTAFYASGSTDNSLSVHLFCRSKPKIFRKPGSLPSIGKNN